MSFSLALVFLIGLAASALCARLRLPGIIGMLLTGIPARSLSTESARPIPARSQRRPAGDGAGHHPAEGRPLAGPLRSQKGGASRGWSN